MYGTIIASFKNKTLKNTQIKIFKVMVVSATSTPSHRQVGPSSEMEFMRLVKTCVRGNRI